VDGLDEGSSQNAPLDTKTMVCYTASVKKKKKKDRKLASLGTQERETRRVLPFAFVPDHLLEKPRRIDGRRS
jgi:hypothetical protein